MSDNNGNKRRRSSIHKLMKSGSDSFLINLGREVSAVLRAAEISEVSVVITDEGILLIPIEGSVSLPKWARKADHA